MPPRPPALPLALLLALLPVAAGDAAPRAELEWAYQPFPAPSIAANLVFLERAGAVKWVLFDDKYTWETLDPRSGTWLRHVYRATEQTPTSGEGHAMAAVGYDRALLFGGIDRQGHVNLRTYTLTWDEGWQYATPSPDDDPPLRAYAAMASVPGSHAVVLFGGFTETHAVLGDTWTFKADDATGASGTWTQVQTPAGAGPAARAFHGFVGGRMVAGGPSIGLLFGGSPNWQRTDCGNDLWLFDWQASSWSAVNDTRGGSVRPTGRCRFVMATPTNTPASVGTFVVFGGINSTAASNTWLFAADGVASGAWQDVTSLSRDSPWKQGTGATYNHGGATSGAGILVVGGNENKNSDEQLPQSQTWLWESASSMWKQVSNVIAPRFRDYHAIASLEGGRAILFGGKIGDTVDGGDTLIFDADLGGDGHGGWSKPFVYGIHPPARAFHAMATVRENLVVLYGGQTDQAGKPAVSNDDTWLYNGDAQVWTQWRDGSTSIVKPPARFCHGMSSLGNGKEVLMFGGYTGATGTPPNRNLQDTWMFDTKQGWTGIHFNAKEDPIPAARNAHVMATLRTDSVVMYGGWTVSDANFMFSDVWRFTVDVGWRRIVPLGGLGQSGRAGGGSNAVVNTDLPAGRDAHGMAQLGPNRVLMAFGYGVPWYLDDAWVLSADTRTRNGKDAANAGGDDGDDGLEYRWTQVFSDNGTPVRRAATAMASTGTSGKNDVRKAIVFGGQLLQIAGSSPIKYTGGDTWFMQDGCPPGTYAPAESAGAGCTACATGRYKDTAGLSVSECTLCPAGLTTAREGAASSAMCDSCRFEKTIDANTGKERVLNHGTCGTDANYKPVWECFPGAYGDTCQDVCPGGLTFVCSGRGTCSQSTDGLCRCNFLNVGLADCSVPLTGIFLLVGIGVFGCLVHRLRVKWRKSFSEQRDLVELQEQLLDDQRQDIEDLEQGWRINSDDLRWIEKVAEGGFGEVWRGRWHLLAPGTDVAIKKMFLLDGELSTASGESSSASTSWGSSTSSTSSAKKALHAFTENLVDADGTVFRDKEISLLMRTRHRRVVLFHGAGRLETTGEIFLVSEFMSGGDLMTWLSDGRVFPFRERVDVARDIAEGMAFLHGKKLIHRDLKSLNVLLMGSRGRGRSARAKIADFGLSRFTQRGRRRKLARKSNAEKMTSSLFRFRTKSKRKKIKKQKNRNPKGKDAPKNGESKRGGSGGGRDEDASDSAQDSDGDEKDWEDADAEHEDEMASRVDGASGSKHPTSGALPHRRKKSTSSFAHVVEMTGRTGSLLWMAPEILEQWLHSKRRKDQEKAKYSMAADVYSMGIVLFELLTRRSPWSDVRPPLTTNVGERVVRGKRPNLNEDDLRRCETDPHAALLASMMRMCWAQTPKKRLPFSKLLQRLGGAREESTSSFASSAAAGADLVANRLVVDMGMGQTAVSKT